MISSSSISAVVMSYPCVIHRYSQPLLSGQFMTRYKRFLADIEFDNIQQPSLSSATPITTVHCPNTGSMLGLLPSENNPRRCACVDHSSSNSKRKYNYTLEMIQDRQKTWVGIHSAFANKLVKHAIVNGYIDEIGSSFSVVNSEVTVKDKCKIDFEIIWNDNNNSNDLNASIISEIQQSNKKRRRKSNTTASMSKLIGSNDNNTRRLLLEVKSVTLAVEFMSNNSDNSDNSSTVLSAQFPDCVSERAQKHTKFLTEYVLHQKATGGNGEAAILFLIQRDDCISFSASHYDTEYRRLLSEAATAGVSILPYHCNLNPHDGIISLLGKIPFVDTYMPVVI